MKPERTSAGKRDFRKVSFTLPPQAYKRLIEESARRRIAGQSDRLMSSILREAVLEYLKTISEPVESS